MHAKIISLQNKGHNKHNSPLLFDVDLSLSAWSEDPPCSDCMTEQLLLLAQVFGVLASSNGTNGVDLVLRGDMTLGEPLLCLVALSGVALEPAAIRCGDLIPTGKGEHNTDKRLGWAEQRGLNAEQCRGLEM